MKTSAEFDNFTNFMDKLAQVPHSELKASLDAERTAKEAKGYHLRRPPEEDPLVKAINLVADRERRRKLN